MSALADPVFSRSLQRELASGVSYPGYSSREAAALCEHATASYRDIHEYQRAVEASGQWDGATMVDGNGAQAVVCSSEHAIVVAVRGTAGSIDVATDGLVCRRGWPGMFPAHVGVHLGFRRQAEAIHDDIEGILRMLSARRMRMASARSRGLDIGFARPKVYITGHSLGGAVASLLHESLQLRTAAAEDAKLYTFGSPRAGGKAWREFARRETPGKRESHRVVVVRRGVQDLVSRVPLSKFGWRHVGEPVVIEDGQVKLGQEAWQQVRAQRKTGLLDAWKALRSVRRGVESHLVGSLLIELRMIARGGVE